MWEPPEYPGPCFDLHFDRFDGFIFEAEKPFENVCATGASPVSCSACENTRASFVVCAALKTFRILESLSVYFAQVSLHMFVLVDLAVHPAKHCRKMLAFWLVCRNFFNRSEQFPTVGVRKNCTSQVKEILAKLQTIFSKNILKSWHSVRSVDS